MRSQAIQTNRMTLLSGLLGLLVANAITAPSQAGPARYDPETKSFKFNYTFASLTDGLFGSAAVGTPQKPSPEQDAKVRAIVLRVSDALSKATSGRAKILTLDFVNDVKDADVVISLSGKPERGGWAIPGAIEGRPGQIGLYYETLAAEWMEDSVLTATHEASHYLFGLVDEYLFPRGCPVANPGGPGCLMDNYLSNGTRHGWYGRYCQDDHAIDERQTRSCQSIVDEFFRARITDGPSDGTGTLPQESRAAATTKTNNRQAIIDNITRATIGKVRDEVEARNKARKGSGSLTSIGALKEFAGKFLESQLRKNGVGLPKTDLANLVDGTLRTASTLIKVSIPPRFEPLVNLIARFAEDRANELKTNSPKDSEPTRKKKIQESLLKFIADLGSNAPTADSAPTPEEKRYLDHVAELAAMKATDEKVNCDVLGATLAHIRLSRETAANVLDIAGEVGVVGIETRLAAIGEVDADLRLYLPGKTASSGFGRRRTIIIDPDPLDPRQDFVITHSGIYRYADLRDQYVDIFSKLIERAKVVLLTTDAQKRRLDARRELLGKPIDERMRGERARRIAELNDRGKVRTQRETDLRLSMNELATQIRGNRVENIVFLVPPGGLPRNLALLFESLRLQLIRKADVRLDIVLVNSADVPFELRDIAIGTGGSIVTIADIDDIGAVAQRLKNEQTSGAWVVLPFQDQIRGAAQTASLKEESKSSDRWVLKDARRGNFLDDPILGPYLDVRQRLENITEYFAVAKREGGKISYDFTQPSSAQNDLERGRILPPAAYNIFIEYVRISLLGRNGKNEDQGDQIPNEVSRRASYGLIKELTELERVIQLYNKRSPGAGDELRLEILEQIIRSKSQYQELKSLLEVALNSHVNFVSSSFDEDAIFRRAFENQKRLDQARINNENEAEKIRKKLFQIQEAQTKLTDELARTTEAIRKWNTDKSMGILNPDEDFIALNSKLKKQQDDIKDKRKEEEALKADPKQYSAVANSKFLILLNSINDDLEVELKKYEHETTLITFAYIRLKQQEVHMRAVGEFLDHIEKELAEDDQTPLFRRIDRDALVQANNRIQDKAPGFIAEIPGTVRRPPLAPVDTLDEKGDPRRDVIRLPRFYAENIKFDLKHAPAEFELIIGLSEPLPGVDTDAIREYKTDLLPELRLYNDNGQLLNTPTLVFDRDLSTSTCLIYHFTPEFGPGWYTGALKLTKSTLRQIGQSSVNMTFSIASTRPNFRLTPAMVQMPNDPELIPPPPNRGLARVMDRRSKVEVQVYGGTSVLGASVRGVLHKLDVGTGTINPIAQDFYDDGKTYGDRKADDGIYTTQIPLDKIEKGMEYRLLIQAESTEVSRNIAPENPNINDDKRRADAKAQGLKDIRTTNVVGVKPLEQRTAERFQRASTIQIRVEP